MDYETVQKLWGAQKLCEQNPKSSRSGRNRKTFEYITIQDIDLDTVIVTTSFSEGYACCGGTDPSCYCSFAQSPSAKVEITGYTKNQDYLSAYIDFEDFDFATMVKELVEITTGATP